MTATAGVINGSLLTVKVGGSLIAAGTTHNFSPTAAVRYTTNKDNLGWRTIMPGVKSWTCSGTHMFTFDATYGYAQLFTAWTNRSICAITFGSATAGDTYFSGSAYITSLPVDAPSEENATFTVQFEGTGAITSSTTT